MSVFTGRPVNPGMQALGTEVSRHVMGTCLAAMDTGTEHFTQIPPGEVSSSIAQGVIAGLIGFATYGRIPHDQIRELIVGATDDMLRQHAEHQACGGQPAGHA